MSHSTQNILFRKRYPEQSLGLLLKKLKLAQQNASNRKTKWQNIQKANINQQSTVKTAHICVHITTHYCSTQYTALRNQAFVAFGIINFTWLIVLFLQIIVDLKCRSFNGEQFLRNNYLFDTNTIPLNHTAERVSIKKINKGNVLNYSAQRKRQCAVSVTVSAP